MDYFHEEMQRGLAGGQGALKMIPTFIGRPTGAEKGGFLALDLGGTNLRILDVTLAGKGKAHVTATERFVIPPSLMGGSGEDLFSFIADCVKHFLRRFKNGGPLRDSLAFTFSFPVEHLSISSGKLISWTKGFTAGGVVGRDVAALLNEALKSKGAGFITVEALTNDTVGTLAAGSYADSTCDMGVILGTGTNACYAERANRIGKLPGLPPPDAEMIVNMEWGNFDRIPRNGYDHALDRASSNPGRQCLEKMASGLYMGEIARRILVEMMRQGLIFRGADPSLFTAEYSLSAEQMAVVVQGGDFPRESGVRELSEVDRRSVCSVFCIVSRRAARLAATAIAAVVLWMDKNLDHFHTIAVDGSLFLKYPGFQAEMLFSLADLLGDRAKWIKFAPTQDGSGTGAAIVAAVASFARAMD